MEVILFKEELLHDIEDHINDVQESFRPDGKALLPGDKTYMLDRHLETAINQAVSRCQAYLFLPAPYVQRISANHAHEWEEKSIFLAMPATWPVSNVRTLRDAVHNFIVMRTCQLFLALKEPKAADICDLQAIIHYNEINSALSDRLEPMYIHPTFLG